MRLRRLKAVAWKELLHVRRDVRSLAMALAVPFVLLMLFGYALTLDVDRVPVLVYDIDRTPASRELVARLEGSRFFDVLGYASGYGQIEREIDAGRCLVALVIPKGYARDILSGRKAEIQILVDGSDSNTASIALGYIDALLASYSQQVRWQAQQRRLGRVLPLALETRLRVWYNPRLQSKNYIVPGLIAVILMIIGALLTSLTIAREWEGGTMEQVLSTPLRPLELVLGKAVAYFLIGVADVVSAVLTGVFIFRVPLRGSLLLLAVSCALFLAGALFWGILISALARSQMLAYQASMISSFLPAFLLSGFVWAIENMPRPVQLVTYAVPARYFIAILKGIFLKGVGLAILWPQLAFLAVYACLVLVVAAKKARQKVV